MLTVLQQTKATVSFPREDKRVVKSITRFEKVMMPHKKKALMRCISMYHVIGLRRQKQ